MLALLLATMLGVTSADNINACRCWQFLGLDDLCHADYPCLSRIGPDCSYTDSGLDPIADMGGCAITCSGITPDPVLVKDGKCDIDPCECVQIRGAGDPCREYYPCLSSWGPGCTISDDSKYGGCGIICDDWLVVKDAKCQPPMNACDCLNIRSSTDPCRAEFPCLPSTAAGCLVSDGPEFGGCGIICENETIATNGLCVSSPTPAPAPAPETEPFTAAVIGLGAVAAVCACCCCLGVLGGIAYAVMNMGKKSRDYGEAEEDYDGE